ncbi:sensor histidine kinase [Streptomyces armeniacus]|uniref:sensor histidine kinase n=1 Tax=Streptomyces armeniacus TaxID=83291 RepID=UPI001FE91DF2|nr:ATP-binding protein [Streptomyces armeniacus]
MERHRGVESLYLASARRFAAPVRGVALVVISSFALLSVPSSALPLGLGLFALMLAGAAVDWCSGLTGRAPALASGFAVVRVVAVCATQEWTGGPPNLWALNTLTTTAITLQWEWPPAITVPVTAGLLAMNLAATGADGAEVLVPRLVFECLLARLGFVLLRRSGRRTDALRERRAALERTEALSLARHRQEREYLALLHDTAAATFLMVAVQGEGADPQQVAAYARRDLTVLTGAAGGATAQDSPVDLAASLHAVAARSRVHVEVVEVHQRNEAQVYERNEGQDHERAGCVPASVALAFVRAVREALVNVERHAGVDTATLGMTLGQVRVTVEVSDHGAGFRPDDVPLFRRGIRASVVERLATVGGRVTVRSHPGGGTTVRMEWSGDE